MLWGPGDGVEQVARYLTSSDGRSRSWAQSGEELVLPVEVDVDWHREEVARRGCAGWADRAIAGALDRVADQRRGDRRGLPVVDRPLLVEVAMPLERTDDALAGCWYTTMCWGSGWTRNHRLHQWMRAIEPENDQRFRAMLQDSAEAVTDGRLDDAYRAALMTGVGEAYATKYLWALGMGGHQGRVAPMVLDSKVWQTLGALGWRPPGRGAAARWVSYCTVLVEWAEALGAAHEDWSIDGERIEQLLFDRDPKRKPEDHEGRCLYAWLRDPP